MDHFIYFNINFKRTIETARAGFVTRQGQGSLRLLPCLKQDEESGSQLNPTPKVQPGQPSKQWGYHPGTPIPRLNGSESEVLHGFPQGSLHSQAHSRAAQGLFLPNSWPHPKVGLFPGAHQPLVLPSIPANHKMTDLFNEPHPMPITHLYSVLGRQKHLLPEPIRKR